MWVAIWRPACVFGVYYNLIDVYDGGERTMTGVNGTGLFFATVPTQGVSLGALFIDNLFNTAFLILGIVAITDQRNTEVSPSMQPLLIGLLATGLIMAFGLNSGAALNPARDLGPRLLLVTAGYGSNSFAVAVQGPSGVLGRYSYFWIPLVACHLGGIIGGFVYDFALYGLCQIAFTDYFYKQCWKHIVIAGSVHGSNRVATEPVNAPQSNYGSFGERNTGRDSASSYLKSPPGTCETHAEIFMTQQCF